MSSPPVMIHYFLSSFWVSFSSEVWEVVTMRVYNYILCSQILLSTCIHQIMSIQRHASMDVTKNKILYHPIAYQQLLSEPPTKCTCTLCHISLPPSSPSPCLFIILKAIIQGTVVDLGGLLWNLCS